MKIGWTAAIAAAMVGTFGCSRSQPFVDSGASPDVVTAKPEAPEAPPDLSLFYSSDGRGQVGPAGEGERGAGGLSRRATVIDRARTWARAVVVVDAGDFLPSPTDGAVGDAGDTVDQRRSIVVASYKRMGVAVVTPGGRELELGSERLAALLRSADIHPVAANLLTKGDALAFERDAIVDTPAMSVGVFGIVELPSESPAILDRLGLTATDGVEAARVAAHSLRERGAGLVVGLFHVAGGAARAAEIVRQAGDIDVVVLGHGADDGKPGVAATEGRTPIVYAGALGSDVGRIDVRSSDAGSPRLDNDTLSLTSSIPSHFGVGLLGLIEPTRRRIAQEKAATAERRKKGQKEPEVYETWTYGSNGACALCHTEATQHWKTTDHAHAMAILKKNRHDRDPACLGCHTTGYLQRGGTQNIDTALEQFAEVGCESCHGPSAQHVRSLDKKKGTSLKVDATVCLGCHTPDQNLGPFDYDAARQAILGPGHGAPPK